MEKMSAHNGASGDSRQRTLEPPNAAALRWEDLFEAGEAFAAGVAGVEVVPEFDVIFILFPAEEHFFTANEGGEVDEAAIDVFNLDFAALKFEEEFFDVAHGPDPGVDDGTAKVGAGRHECANAFFLFLEVLAVV